jgi:hypothetical protein
MAVSIENMGRGGEDGVVKKKSAWPWDGLE